MRSFTFFLILLFVAVTFSGFAVMTHSMAMDGSCLTKNIVASMCLPDGAVMAFQHISAYISFSGVIVFVTSILSVIFLSILYFIVNVFVFKYSGCAYFSYKKHLSREISKWLSLFENSPSVA